MTGRTSRIRNDDIPTLRLPIRNSGQKFDLPLVGWAAMDMYETSSKPGAVTTKRDSVPITNGFFTGGLRQFNRRPLFTRTNREDGATPTFAFGGGCPTFEPIHDELVGRSRSTSESRNASVAPMDLMVHATTDWFPLLSIKRIHTEFAKPVEVSSEREVLTVR